MRSASVLDFGLGQDDLRHARPGAADDLDAGAAHARNDRFRRAHVDAVDLARDQRLHQRGAGFDLQEFDFQPALGGKAAFVDHRDEACIALGFKDAVLPDFLLRMGGGEATASATAADANVFSTDEFLPIYGFVCLEATVFGIAAQYAR